jgi:hypothetical protein
MKDIDKGDAPLGYVAYVVVEPVEWFLECAFYEDFSGCFIASKRCAPSPYPRLTIY